LKVADGLCAEEPEPQRRKKLRSLAIELLAEKANRSRDNTSPGPLCQPRSHRQLRCARRIELRPATGVSYLGFVDPSGGASDATALPIAHRLGDVVILDVGRRRE
jgi:hypothetical protein